MDARVPGSGPGDSDPVESDPGDTPPAAPFSALALRVFSFFLAALLGMILGTAAAAFLLGRLGVDTVTLETLMQSGLESEPALGLWLRAGSLPLVLWIVYLFTVRFDETTLGSVGLKRPRRPAGEALLGSLAAALTLMAWLVSILPATRSEPLAWTPADGADGALGLGGLPALAVAFLLVAFQDELIFRGYIFSTFRERFSWVHAAGLTNLMAVALYAGHPEVGTIALLNVFLLGLALAAIRERTGSLFMGTLFAGVWNLVLGCVLSLPISGVLFPRLFNHRLEGSSGLTGGDYGPEGSWVLSIFLLMLVSTTAVWAERAPGSGAGEDAVEDAEADVG